MKNTAQNIVFENIETDNPAKQGDTFAEIDPGHGTREVRVRDTEQFVERCNDSGWDIKKITRYVKPVETNMAGSLPMTNQR